MSLEAHETGMLPLGWSVASIGEFCKIVGGGTPSTQNEMYWQGTIPWVTSADIEGIRVVRPRKAITQQAIQDSATNFVPANSILVVTRVGLGKVALVVEPLCFSQDCQALVFDTSQVDPLYLTYYLKLNVQVFKHISRGTTISGVTKKQLAELKVFLPPYNEQKRIVAAIDTQFTRLDACTTGLKAIQAKLKRYRAAVLKAAVDGTLTVAWRAQHPDVESASVLLERIVANSASIANKQRSLFSDKSVSGDEVPSTMPSTWHWACVNQLGDVQLGRQRAPQHHTGMHMRPYLRVANVYEDRLDLSDILQMNFTPVEYETYRLEYGDILLNEGQSLELAGRPAMYRDEVPGACFQNTLIRFRAFDGVLSQYALLVFRAYLHSGRFRRIARWTTNIAHLGAGRFAQVGFPLPPLDEQQQIVAEVDRRLSVVAEIEAQIQAALKRAERLRQSILKEAFTGRLVPQNQEDEPADMLLQHMRAARASTAGETTPRQLRLI